MDLFKQPPERLGPYQKRKLIKRIIERDKGLCVWCERPANDPAHIVRVSQGGEDTDENVVCACRECHDLFDQYKIGLPESVKDRMTPEHWEQYEKSRKTMR